MVALLASHNSLSKIVLLQTRFNISPIVRPSYCNPSLDVQS